VEGTVFDVAKLLRLLLVANPNALEILFADERDWVLETPTWRKLHAHRHLFLTRRVRETFLGYAMAQLKRIKTHRAWLLEPPKTRPARDAFGLPVAGGTLDRDAQHRIEQAVAEKLRAYRLDAPDLPKPIRLALNERIGELYRDLLSAPEEEVELRLRAVATHALGLAPELVSTLNAERAYRAAMKHWESYRTWQRQRNPARAELERQHGYDTKHAMHLVRLMRMGLEALEEGELRVRRPDADELRAIRDGALSFEALMAEAKGLEDRIAVAASTTTLPEAVDADLVDALLLELVASAPSSPAASAMGAR